MKIGRTVRERCFPARAELHFADAARVIKQTDVGATHRAVKFGREAVRRNVHDALTARQRLPDQTLDARAIRQVVAFDDLGALRCPNAARRL